MKVFLVLILPYVWLPLYVLGLYGCIISLVKGHKFAEKKKYTPEQKKKYFVTWCIALLLLMFLTILEVRDIIEIIK